MTFVKNCKIALDILCGRLKDIFNHELFNPNSGVEKSGFGYFMVEKSGVEKSGVEMSSQSLGLKLGVEKSRVEMSSEDISTLDFTTPSFNPRL